MLLEIEANEKGGRPKNRVGGDPVLTRAGAAKAARFTHRVRKTALEVARIPEDEFDF